MLGNNAKIILALIETVQVPSNKILNHNGFLTGWFHSSTASFHSWESQSLNLFLIQPFLVLRLHQLCGG